MTQPSTQHTLELKMISIELAAHLMNIREMFHLGTQGNKYDTYAKVPLARFSRADQHGLSKQEQEKPGTDGNCGALSATASCAGLVRNLEAEDGWRNFGALGPQGLTDEEKFVRGDLAALAPITNSRRADARQAGRCGRSA